MENFCTLLQCKVHLSMFHSSLPLRFGIQVPNMMCIEMVQKLKLHSSKFLPQRRSNFAVLAEPKGINLSFHFKRYNLTIRVLKFCKTFRTCFPNSLVQDPRIESAKK
jgi:hypothetical protein